MLDIWLIKISTAICRILKMMYLFLLGLSLQTRNNNSRHTLLSVLYLCFVEFWIDVRNVKPSFFMPSFIYFFFSLKFFTHQLISMRKRNMAYMKINQYTNLAWWAESGGVLKYKLCCTSLGIFLAKACYASPVSEPAQAGLIPRCRSPSVRFTSPYFIYPDQTGKKMNWEKKEGGEKNLFEAD